MKATPNPWLVPVVTGWKFVDPSGGTITGGNLASLIAAVEAYRRRNGLSEGNPEEEVPDQLCQRNPHFCSTRHAPPVSKSAGDKVVAWVAQIARVPHVLASLASPVTAARVAACVNCPQNDVRFAPSCGSCGKNAIELEKSLGVPNKRLMHCGQYKWSNAIACRVSTIPADQAAPSNCWRHPDNFQSFPVASEAPVHASA